MVAVYLESGKDVRRIVVKPDEDGADDVAEGEVGEQSVMNGARSSNEA